MKCTAEYLKARRERFAYRGESFYENIDEDKELKMCSHCNRLLPLKKFQRDIHRLEGYSTWCKDCRAEYQFLYRKPGARNGGGYLLGTGICLICGEIHPIKLETHHLFGRKNSDTLIALCGICHLLQGSSP